MIHKPRCEVKEITTIIISNEPQRQGKKHFNKNALYFRIIAEFEAANEIDKSSKGFKTFIIHIENPACNGCCIVSELEGV